MCDILLLGDPRLYEKSEAISETELNLVDGWVSELHNAMEDIRAKYNFGRAIAAPQLGIMKRLVYMNVDKPVTLINPVITEHSYEQFNVLDDCMCFPELLVKVKRYKKIKIEFVDKDWKKNEWSLENDLAELLQHECDHLDGVLCTQRAINNKSFLWRNLNSK